MSNGSGTITPPYTALPDSTLTAGKPWTQTLARTLRDNVEHVHALMHDTVHGHDHDGANSAFLSAAASFALPLNTSEKASGSGGAGTGAWTTISIASDTGSQTAKIAILRLCATSLYAGSDPATCRIEIRATGTTPTSPRRAESGASGAADDRVERTVFVPLDGSEQFDYRVVRTAEGSAMNYWEIHLEGWIV